MTDHRKAMDDAVAQMLHRGAQVVEARDLGLSHAEAEYRTYLIDNLQGVVRKVGFALVAADKGDLGQAREWAGQAAHDLINALTSQVEEG